MSSIPRSTFNLPFLKGERTNASKKYQLDGELRSLENAEISTLGDISKRLGYSALTRSINGGGTISSGASLATFNEELLLFDGYHAYAYSPGLTKWIDRGKAQSVVIDTETIIHNDGYQQTCPTMAVLGNLEVTVWNDERGGLRYSLIDTETRSMITADQQLSSSLATTLSAHAIAFSNHLVIAYSLPDFTGSGGQKLWFKTIDSSGALSGETLIGSPENGDFDMCIATSGGVSRLFFAYHNGPSSFQHTFFYLDTSFVKSSDFHVHTNNDTTDATCLVSDASGQVYKIWHDTTFGASVMVINFANNAVVLAQTTSFFNLLVLGGAYRITGYVDPVSSLIHIYMEVGPVSGTTTDGWRHSIVHQTCSILGVKGSDQAFFARSVGIFGKPFEYGGTWFIPCAHEAPQQATTFILDDAANIVAKIGYQTSGGLEAINYAVSDVCSPSAGTFAFAYLTKGHDESEADGYGDTTFFFSRLGVSRAQCNFVSENAFQSAKAITSMTLAGGLVQSYDRYALHESNFNLYPENIIVEPGIVAGHMVNGGEYQYKVVYRWTDASGNDQISRPSTSAFYNADTGSIGSTSCKLTINFLQLTTKVGVRIEVYRTKESQSVFRQVSSLISPVYNILGTESQLTFIDTLADDDLDAAPLLYTEGESANLAISNAKSVCLFKERLFFAGLEDSTKIQFTKLLTPGIAPETCEDSIFSQAVDSYGGKIMDLAVLGDQLIIFKEGAIYSLSGEGPDNNGAATEFNQSGVPITKPAPLSLSVGVSRSNLIASIPPGLIFVSSDGKIYLLSSAGLAYQDKPMAHESLSFTSVDRIDGTNQVRFTSEEGTMLVFDYQYDNWSTIENRPAVDACLYQGRHCLLQSDGHVYLQNEETDNKAYEDSDGYIVLEAESTWFFPAGVQGFCILDKLLIDGEYLSSHFLTVSVFTDGNETTAAKTFTINATALSSQYVFELGVNKRCESFKVVLSDNGTGASAKISNLRCVLAVLPGNNRLASRRKI